MELTEARHLLGVAEGAPMVEVRVAYRAALRRTHPDLHGGDGAPTRAVVAAYRALAAAPSSGTTPATATAATATATAATATATATVVNGDTVAADLPAGDLFAMLAAVATRIGDLVAADRDTGRLEIVVDVAGHGTCLVVLTLEDRGPAHTLASCTVEPLDGEPAPAAAVVAALLAEGLRSLT